jgi:hypothetical protein
MIDNDKILQIVSMKGTIIPKDLTKTFNTDTFMIGAALSELIRAGKLGITSVKIGGSPFYFIPSQKEKLQQLNKYLNEKDQKAYNLLKEKQILRDSELTPLLRVSMRSIKDFALPIEAKTTTSSEIFWKWYMLSNEQCISLIKTNFFPDNNKQQSNVPVKDPVVNSEIKEKIEIEKPQSIVHKPKEKLAPITVPRTGEQAENKEVDGIEKPTIKDRIKAVFDDLSGQRKEIETDKKISNDIVNREVNKKEYSKEIVDEKKALIEKLNVSEIKHIKPKNHEKNEEQKKLKESENKFESGEVKQEIRQELEEPSSELYLKTKKYFNKHNIKLVNVEIIRKNREFDCLVEIPSPVGNVEYYCKVKAKKKCNDGDLATAYVNAQMKNLPTLFITTGEVTKKAEEMLQTKFKNMKIIKLG